MRRITVVNPNEMFKMFNDTLSLGDSDFKDIVDVQKTSLKVNVSEFSDKFVITAILPGFKKDEVNISFQSNTLVIEATKKEENESSESNVILQEYSLYSLERKVTLPEKVDVDNAEAKLSNGIMTIIVPKLPEILPKKISIK